MSLYEIEGHRPQFPDDSFVHPEAVLIGDVRIGHECYIAAGVVIRAEFGSVEIGNFSNVQDNATIHVDPDKQVMIEENVIIAHGAILHDVHIKARCVIGMGSILLFNAVCGEDVLVTAGSVVPVGMQIPDGKIVSGNPAQITRDVSDKQRLSAQDGIDVYRKLCAKYLSSMKKIG